VWTVELSGGETRRDDALLVANGHRWDPRWPEPRYPGRFDGLELRVLESHPTISADFLGRIAQGEVTWKPGVASLAGDSVRFVDGSVEPIDVIVWCTGYKVSFPCFDPEFLSAPDNELLLYRRVFMPGVANLFFVALLQPIGAMMPLAEAQGRWIAAYLRGEYRLPVRAGLRPRASRSRYRRAQAAPSIDLERA
jgi:cation diffusion facilitator CzcD-associated flavoprotein CzcO